MTANPFAGIPNADDSLNGEFSPARTAPSRPRGLDIIERTGQAEYYLREARRAGLPLPAYVTVSAHHDGSHIGIQLASTDDVGIWALHFGAQLSIRHGGISAELGDYDGHEVSAYYMFPEPAPKPAPEWSARLAEQFVPGLAEHTAAAPFIVGDHVRNRYTGAIGVVTKASPDFVTVQGDEGTPTFSGWHSAFEPFHPIPGLAEHTAAAQEKIIEASR